jgi:hypothetical protein
MNVRDNVDHLANDNSCMLQTVQVVMRKPDPGTEWDVPLYVLCWQLACQLFCVE